MSNSSSSRKRVTFNAKVSGIETLNIDDFTPSEIAASWFNEEEMEQITKRCYKILRRMEGGNDSRKYCMRGLEGHTSVGHIIKKKNRTAAMAAVLTVQAEQWDEQKFDDQAIADAYQRTSSSCQLWAQVIGKRDEESAEAIHYPNEESDEEILPTASTAIPTIARPQPEYERITKMPRTSPLPHSIPAC